MRGGDRDQIRTILQGLLRNIPGGPRRHRFAIGLSPQAVLRLTEGRREITTWTLDTIWTCVAPVRSKPAYRRIGLSASREKESRRRHPQNRNRHVHAPN